MVCHHLDAVKALATYDRSKALLSRNQEKMDWKALDDFDEVMRIAEAIEIVNVSLGQTEIVRIMDFLGALSDESAGKTRAGLDCLGAVGTGDGYAPELGNTLLPSPGVSCDLPDCCAYGITMLPNCV